MNKGKKRKLISNNDQDEDDGEDNIFTYSLNKLKALQKKIDSTTTDESITMKGNPGNIQIVVDCSTAVFELVRSIFQTSIQEQNLYVTKKMNKDKDKNTTATIFNVKNKKKSDRRLYTANFYHTTSRILVNAIKDVDVFISHYSKLVGEFQPETIANLNEKVRSSCSNAIESLKNKQTNANSSTTQQQSTQGALGGSAVSLPESSQCSMSETMETLAPLINSTPSHSRDRDCGESPECASYRTLHGVLSDMMEKMDNMQEKMDRMQAKLDNFTSAFSESPSTKECQSNSKNTIQQTYLPTQTPNTTQQWSSVASSSRQLHRNIPSTTHQNTPTPISPAATSNAPDHMPSTRKTARPNNFNPKHCIVISINKSSKTYQNYNQDNIRREINREFGPTIIENITTYNFKTESPKIMLHLRDEKTVTKLINTWNTLLFENSQVRKTINPESAKVNTGMLRGIPIDADDELVIKEISQKFPNSSAMRIYKGEKKMRIFKVKFETEDQYNKVLSQGMILDSLKLKCHFEKLL